MTEGGGGCIHSLRGGGGVGCRRSQVFLGRRGVEIPKQVSESERGWGVERYKRKAFQYSGDSLRINTICIRARVRTLYCWVSSRFGLQITFASVY